MAQDHQWMQVELDLTSHKAKEIHQGEHLKNSAIVGYITVEFFMWHWVCMT